MRQGSFTFYVVSWSQRGKVFWWFNYHWLRYQCLSWDEVMKMENRFWKCDLTLYSCKTRFYQEKLELKGYSLKLLMIFITLLKLETNVNGADFYFYFIYFFKDSTHLNKEHPYHGSNCYFIFSSNKVQFQIILISSYFLFIPNVICIISFVL